MLHKAREDFGMDYKASKFHYHYSNGLEVEK